MVKVNEGVRGPESLLQFFARDYFSGALQQQRQHLKGLALQTEFYAVLAQLARAQVELEHSKPRESALVLWHDAVV
jgi:hypothetical protein